MKRSNPHARHHDNFDIPPAWEKALGKIAGQAGLCMVVGPVDAGKSSFCLLLARRAQALGRRPAILDCDPGQSDIGPPTSLGLACIEDRFESYGDLPAQGIFFLGATTPVGHLLEAAAGAGRLAQKARASGAELIIVNTTGLVQGGIARALKAAKVRLLGPSMIVSIAAAGETDTILAPLRGRADIAIRRLRPSGRARARSAEERKARREAAFKAYFAQAKEIALAFGDVAIEGGLWLAGRPLEGASRACAQAHLEEKIAWAEHSAEGNFFVLAEEPRRGQERALQEALEAPAKIVGQEAFASLLVGIVNAEGEDMGMGILQAVDFSRRKLRLVAPLASGKGIAALRPGFMRVSPQGAELGNLPPSIWG